MLGRGLDDGAELPVLLLLEADIARVDAVLVERLGAGRMIGQELVADVVEVADDRRVHAHLEQALLDVRNRGRRLVAIDGNAHDLGTRARQRRHLPHCSVDIGGIGIGHGLHDDGGAAADQHPADIDGHRPSSFLRPGFGHLWAPLRSSALRSVGSPRRSSFFSHFPAPSRVKMGTG